MIIFMTGLEFYFHLAIISLDWLSFIQIAERPFLLAGTLIHNSSF